MAQVDETHFGNSARVLNGLGRFSKAKGTANILKCKKVEMAQEAMRFYGCRLGP
jgi:hypothetical protein